MESPPDGLTSPLAAVSPTSSTASPVSPALTVGRYLTDKQLKAAEAAQRAARRAAPQDEITLKSGAVEVVLAPGLYGGLQLRRAKPSLFSKVKSMIRNTEHLQTGALHLADRGDCMWLLLRNLEIDPGDEGSVLLYAVTTRTAPTSVRPLTA